MTSVEEMQYEKTLMYGHYSELQRFAREFSAAHRAKTQPQPPGIEEAMKKMRKTYKIRRYVSEKILPYVVDWLFILILGISMAFLSFVIDYLIDIIGQSHVILALRLQPLSNPFQKYFLWVFFPLVLILFSVAFVQVVSIHAIGSGIPEMKTVLRGIYLTDYLTIRTFIAKTVALITAVGSSLPIGKEGPFVHISSIIAHVMSKFVTTINRLYANEAHNNELLAAACAVGVSSNFGAPIGGVLFSIEVTSTYFAVRNYWRGFFGAVCGAFLFRLAAVWFKNEETITALFKTSFRPDFPFDLQELSAFAFIGIVAGLVGVAFVWFHKQYVHARRKLRSYTRLLERHVFIYPVIVTILFTSLTFPLGLGKFMAGELTQHQAIDHLFSNVTWSTLPPPDEAFQDLPEDSVEYQIVRQWGQPNIFVTLLLFSALRFVFTAIAVSLPIPSGVFFPVFVIGAGLGRLVGEAMATAFPGGVNGSIVSPGGYAVVGAAALAGSVTHTISTSVIVFELTGQITHILPVMIAVLISNAVASALQPSIYDSIILLKQLSYLPDLKANKYYNLYATDIMQMDLTYVSYRSTYRDLKDLLQTTHHPSYPLVDAPDSRILIGSVSRHNLAALLEDHLRGLYKHAQQIRDTQDVDDVDGRSGRVTPDRAADLVKRRISSVPHSLAKIFGASNEPDFPEVDDKMEWSSDQDGPKQALDELKEELLSQTIDFKKSYIDPAPFQLVERTSLYKIHSLFSILCLSHAYVTSIGRLVGMVTLKDLREAIEGKLKPIEERSRTATQLVEISSTL